MRLILASSSPRRKQLLATLGLPYDVRVPDVDEDAIWMRHWKGPATTRHAARRMALAKARAVQSGLTESEPALILAADTVVVHGDLVLGKPKDPADARRMLRRLSNSVHDVVTGVALLPHPAGRPCVAAARTQVRFAWLTDAEIEGYVATLEPMDKAGAYGIQGQGGLLVESIHGSYDNVVGLPLRLIYRLLRRMQIDIWTPNSERLLTADS